MYHNFNDYYQDRRRENVEKYRTGKTMLSYFRYNVGRQCSSIKYLNNAFLRAFTADYNEAVKTGLPVYHRTKETAFYIHNGPAYCVFLEAWDSYKAGMRKLQRCEEE